MPKHPRLAALMKESVRVASMKSTHPRVVALVPVYNEEAEIERTISSLMSQTCRFEYVLVIANNCTDRTVEIIEDLQKIYGPEMLRLVDMGKNPYLKSGALNYGFKLIDAKNIDFVFNMDGDTIVHKRIVEVGLKKFAREPKTGGICSACRTMPLKPFATRWERFLWRMQNIEYSLSNAWRIESLNSARVLSGAASLFRMSALCDVRKLNRQRGLGDDIVWVNDCLVEDYLLTLDLKDLGWETKSCHEMISWPAVPLKLNGPGGLWRQRCRWASGTIDVIRKRGIRRNSWYDTFGVTLLILNFPMRLLMIAAYIAIFLSGIPIQIIPIYLLLPIVIVFMQIYKLSRYGDQLDGWQYFYAVTLLPIELYATYREVLYIYSTWLSFRRPKRAW